MNARAGVAFLLLAAAFSGCSPPRQDEPAAPGNATPSASPTPLPSVAPAPLFLPQKRLDTAKLFNGLEVRSTLATEPGGSATTERNTSGSYALDLQLRVKVPAANVQELAAVNDALPKLLPALSRLLITAKVSPFFENLYRWKLATLQQNLPRLDQLLSRHNFYDCETILELQNAATQRRALLIQADMDIDTDGSDGDRTAPQEADSPTFQTMTSYKWPKKTAAPNPYLASRETRLPMLEASAGKFPNRDQREALDELRYEVKQLKTNSFLIASADPYIVLPSSLLAQNGQPFSPHIGDYCVVIFKNELYPAIVGDVGPRDKIGEASLRLGKEINAASSADNRPVSALKITYLVFPNTADKPFAPPDLAKWHARCEALLSEFGGHTGELHAWTEVAMPVPTPTPIPTPTPTPTPSATPTSSPAATGSPTVVTSPPK